MPLRGRAGFSRRLRSVNNFVGIGFSRCVREAQAFGLLKHPLLYGRSAAIHTAPATETQSSSRSRVKNQVTELVRTFPRLSRRSERWTGMANRVRLTHFLNMSANTFAQLRKLRHPPIRLLHHCLSSCSGAWCRGRLRHRGFDSNGAQ